MTIDFSDPDQVCDLLAEIVKPKRRKFNIVVEVNMDAVPGFLHEEEDWEINLKDRVNQAAEGYKPEISCKLVK